ncbi:MAG: sodium:proton antiporter NhaD [Xanthomonadales bacterium]|nr:sodium:proton antiporter NhaD [Xanthomonadales bacterium]
MTQKYSTFLPILFLLLPWPAFSNELATAVDLTNHWVGYLCLLLFILAYTLVILEEKLELKKSKPVLLAAGLIWIFIAASQLNTGHDHLVEQAIRHNLLEYAELFFFLLVAMAYINAIAERGVFDALRDWLIYRGFSYLQLFWLTGIMSFFLSPVADNLTTSLIMCAVVMAVGSSHKKFIGLSCINIVVAANAGGAFSPFGDITTLMVWQKGMVPFEHFIKLFIPSLVNFLVPAAIMSFAITREKPYSKSANNTIIKAGGIKIVFLFLATIITAVCFHSVLDLPPVFGMMFGLGYLKIYSYFLNRQIHHHFHESGLINESDDDYDKFDVFNNIARAEWDTLFFFYGVILCVGGLGFIGYLAHASEFFYGNFGATYANIFVGLISAIIDNIPVMFAVLTMNPDMPELQWLLVTLTAGVGGSLLSIGSAAGVALMGQARGNYTFFMHLKWTPVIALGYVASIAAHFLIN